MVGDTRQEFIIKLMEKMLTVKSTDWVYEKEGRILARNQGAKNIDPAYLKQVCFGMNTPDGDMELMQKLLEKEYKQVGIAKIVSDGTDFGIKVIDI